MSPLKEKRSKKSKNSNSESLSKSQKIHSTDGLSSKVLNMNIDENSEVDLVLEDPYGDDVEEDIVHDSDINGDDTTGMMNDEDKEQETVRNRMYLHHVDNVSDNGTMEYDNTAYVMLHQMKLEFPFLSFDFIKDTLGEQRVKFPKTAFMLGGTQADKSNSNKLQVCKLSNMYKTHKDRLDDCDELSDSDDSDTDDDVDDDATLDFRSIPHKGAVNRVRSMPQYSHIAATWSDSGAVYVWDLTKQLISLGARPVNMTPESKTAYGEHTLPVGTSNKHKVEGYAMDWSPVKVGQVATGDCEHFIYLGNVSPAGQFVVEDKPLLGHTDSVEDLQWSPNENSVLASCSVDRTVRVWDVRERNKSMSCIPDAHSDDVNVISWNHMVPFLIASGGDDGAVKVWDLRMLKSSGNDTKPHEPVGFFHWHNAPITSLMWHPQDETVLVASGANNQVSIWDFALEADIEQVGNKLHCDVIGANGELVDIPSQLLFVHEGQNDIKEIRFHPQIPGLIGSSAADGFHIFIPEPLDPKVAQKYLQ